MTCPQSDPDLPGCPLMLCAYAGIALMIAVAIGGCGWLLYLEEMAR